MLLAVPKRHLSQEELWSDVTSVARVAAAMGRLHCPNGFRLVSNFGWDALQSQPHAHIHVIGGGSMDAVTPLSRPVAEVIERDGLRVSVAARGEWPPVFMVGEPTAARSQEELWQDISALGAELVRLGVVTCPGGFRLLSNFGWDALQAHPGGHLYLLGGDELGHYV
jgi:histidine triad (HIT) family protein